MGKRRSDKISNLIYKFRKQVEAEVVRSSSLVEVEIEVEIGVEVEVEVGVEVEVDVGVEVEVNLHVV